MGWLLELPYIKQAMIGIFLSCLVTSFLLWKSNVSLNQEIVHKERDLEVIQATLKAAREDFELQSILLAKAQKQTIEVDKKNKELRKELEGYKNREEVVIQKPSLVERRINAASDSVLQSWGCTPSCKE